MKAHNAPLILARSSLLPRSPACVAGGTCPMHAAPPPPLPLVPFASTASASSFAPIIRIMYYGNTVTVRHYQDYHHHPTSRIINIIIVVIVLTIIHRYNLVLYIILYYHNYCLVLK